MKEQGASVSGDSPQERDGSWWRTSSVRCSQTSHHRVSRKSLKTTEGKDENETLGGKRLQHASC